MEQDEPPPPVLNFDTIRTACSTASGYAMEKMMQCAEAMIKIPAMLILETNLSTK